MPSSAADIQGLVLQICQLVSRVGKLIFHILDALEKVVGPVENVAAEILGPGIESVKRTTYELLDL